MSGTRSRGWTLVEVLVSAALFSLLSIVLFMALRKGAEGWRAIDARYDAARSLRQAENRLLADLRQANPARLAHKRISTSTGNGDVLWFLSAIDPLATGPNSERVVRDPGSSGPRWQRTIVYYCIRPQNHDAMFGQSCGVDTDVNGDAYCPHKFLIRKVVNRPANPETLMSAAEINTYTTKPVGFSVAGFAGEAGLEETKIVSDRFLWFKVTHPAGARLVTIDLRAVKLAEARRVESIGSVSLLTSRFTVHHQVRYLGNNWLSWR